MTDQSAPSNDDNPTDSDAVCAAQKTGHPTALLFFFFGEFAERASYYGMRAILPLYLTSQLHFSDAAGGALYYWFKMACYALPLLGGFLADRYFGKYRTIVGFSIPYVLGHFVLGIENIPATIIALILLAGGSGVIKPNISTLMGQTYDQQRPGQTMLRSVAFMWFYFAINVGALISQVAVPYVRDNYGYATAFQFPAWLMVISLGVFASGKQFYATETTSYAKPTAEERAERWKVFGRLLGVFGMIALFWVPYEHNDSIWVFFARDYVNLQVPLSKLFWTGGIVVAPDQLQALNPLLVLICVPLFSWLLPKFDPQARIFTAHGKILTGFAFGAISCGIMTIAGFFANEQTKISMLWLVAAYILITVAEVLVYGTGLDLAFSEAPKTMKGFITGCFLLTTTLANFVNVFWSQYYGGSLTTEVSKRGSMSPGVFFGYSSLFAIAPLLMMLFMTRRSKSKSVPTA